MATVTGPAPATSPIAAWSSRASSRRSSLAGPVGAGEHDDRTAVKDRETAWGADGEALADDVEVAPLAVMRARRFGGLAALEVVDVGDVQHEQVARLGQVVAEAGRPGGDSLLAGVRAAQQVRGGLTAQALLDLDGGAHLGEGEGHARRGRVDQRPIDRAEVLVGRDEEVAGHLRVPTSQVVGHRVGQVGWARVGQLRVIEHLTDLLVVKGRPEVGRLHPPARSIHAARPESPARPRRRAPLRATYPHRRRRAGPRRARMASRRASREFITQLSATPPARQRLRSPVRRCSQLASFRHGLFQHDLEAGRDVEVLRRRSGAFGGLGAPTSSVRSIGRIS